jgi:aminoglycoside phosphotransferase (APT) family kinase protein
MKGRLLNNGRCAEVYEWGEDHVLKVFLQEFAADAAFEFQNNQAIKDVGISFPLAESILEVDGRTSIVFERVQGMSMLEHIVTNPSALTEMAFRLGQLHAEMHSHSCKSLPLQMEYLSNKIKRADIDKSVRIKALKCLEQLPRDDKLCHGDFHPGNVMVTQTSPMIIDWVTATQGNPLADIVWTRLILKLDNLPEGDSNKKAIDSVRPTLYEGYHNGYRKVRDVDNEALRQWVFPVAVARLGDGLLSERQQLLYIIQKYTNHNDSG